MKIRTLFLSLLFLVISLSSCQTDEAIDERSKDAIIAKHLLTIQQVKEKIDTKQPLILIDVSKKKKYDKAHLPNALNIWRPDYGSKATTEFGGMIASKTEMETLLSAKGVTPNSEIILYDTKGSCDAIRVLWILTMYGHEKVAIMNGGKVVWQKANYPLTKEIPSPTPTAYRFPTTNNFDRYATLDDVKAAIKDSNTILLDTRELEEYQGRPYISKGELFPYKKGAFTYGCIPTAVHLNWSDAVDLSDDHRIKCIKDLKYNFQQKGITPDKKIITYCQSGVRSMHTTYVLTEILGYPNVKNYDGSWIEWTYHYRKNKSVDIEQHITKEEHEKLLLELKSKM